MNKCYTHTTKTFTSLCIHLTSLPFCKHFMTHIHTLVITLPTISLELCGLQGTVASTSAGSWFQSFMVLCTKEYFPISVLCFLSQSSLLRQHGPCNQSPIAFHASSPVFEESAYVRYLSVLC